MEISITEKTKIKTSNSNVKADMKYGQHQRREAEDCKSLPIFKKNLKNLQVEMEMNTAQTNQNKNDMNKKILRWSPIARINKGRPKNT